MMITSSIGRDVAGRKRDEKHGGLRRLAFVVASAFLWSFVVSPALASANEIEPTAAKREHPINPKSIRISGAPSFDFASAARHAVKLVPSTESEETLMTDVALFKRPVSATQVQGWKIDAASILSTPHRKAWCHVWLGEYALVKNQDPEEAIDEFQSAARVQGASANTLGLAAYDTSLALYYEGAYGEAAKAFDRLASTKTAMPGYDRRRAEAWLRHAEACSAYHLARACIGIPEPPRLDPQCGIASLAACLRDLGLPYDVKTLRGHCRVTGEGSTLTDLIVSSNALHVSMVAVGSDDVGLKLLPKPLIAFVERDHFVAVVGTDTNGVSYLCSDCGAWPGGLVHLTWRQWDAFNAGPYAVVTTPGSQWDMKIRQLPVGHVYEPKISGERVAYVGSGAGLLAHPTGVDAVFSLMAAHGHVYRMAQTSPFGCGQFPGGLPCPPIIPCPTDKPPLCPGYSGPAGLDPVNLASGEEEYGEVTDLAVYNPHGPSVDWGRTYDSLRGGGDGYIEGDPTYECNDFGVGWSTTYNFGVYSSDGDSGTGTKYVQYPNGSRVPFTPPAVPTSSQPVVHCASGQPGNALLLDWMYDGSTSGHYVITMPTRMQFVTGGLIAATSVHEISTITDPYGNSIYLNYSGPLAGFDMPLLSSISTRPSGAGTVLLSIERASDGFGSITSITDCYGRSVYYNVSPQPDFRGSLELDHVSQIVSSCPTSIADRYIYGYQVIQSGFSTGAVDAFAYLHSITVPSPTGTGTSTAYINYDPAYGTVASLVDANGNVRRYSQAPYSIGWGGQPVPLPANWNSNSGAGGTTWDGQPPLMPGIAGAVTTVEVDDPSGNKVNSYTVTYDSSMDEISRTDGAGNLVEQLTYDDPVNPYGPSLVEDGAGHQWGVAYDQFGHVVQSMSMRGAVWLNPDGNQGGVQVIPPGDLPYYYVGGHRVVAQYDYSQFALGELTEIEDTGATSSNGDNTQLAKTPINFTYYEPSGLVQTVSAPTPGTVNGPQVTTSFTWDQTTGNILTINRPGTPNSITSTFNYTSDPGDSTHGIAPYSQTAAFGQALTITDNLGKSAHLRYNAQGQATAVIDALGNETDLAYNIANDLTTVTLPPTGQTGTGRAYSLSSYLYPGGPQTTISAYDESGMLVRQATSTYGLEGETLSVSGSTEPVSVSYDAMYRPISLTDGNGHTTRYYYNLAGYFDSATYPGYSGPTPAYDPSTGSWDNVAGADSFRVSQYDGSGSPLKSVDGNGVETDYTYNDPDGYLTNVHYPGGQLPDRNYAYDPVYGLLTGIADGVSSRSYSYDDLDEVTASSVSYTGGPQNLGVSYSFYPSGDVSGMTTPGGSFSYTYDADERLQTLTNPYNETSSWSYYDNWLPETQTLANGATTTYSYNAWGNPSDATTKTSTGSLLSQFTSITYNGAGNTTSVTANIPASSAASGTTAYQFDNGNAGSAARGQLTQEQSTRGIGYTFGYGYDSAGNTTTFKGSTLGFNDDNQNSAFSFNGNGDPVGYGGSALSFDAEDNLTGVGSAMSASYMDDGLRASKESTYYVYDGVTPVCETNSSGAVTAVNTFGDYGLLSRKTTAADKFYTFDAQGNTAQRLDGSGNIISTDEYDAYGVRTSTDQSDPFGYQGNEGYYTDTETGLIYLTNRYYDPSAGRFVNRDPIGYSGGIDVYAYCENDPVDNTDPLGLESYDFSDFNWQQYGKDSSDFGQGLLRGLGNQGAQYGMDNIESVIMVPFDVEQEYPVLKKLRHPFTYNVGGPCNEEEREGEQVGWALGYAFRILSMFAKCINGCFVAGTPVQMADGTTKPIEQLKPGDKVISRDETNGNTEVKTVTAVTAKAGVPTLKLTFSDGQSITTTAAHPFYVDGKGFTPAGRLAVGNAIVTRAGPPVKVMAIEREALATVYNLTVDGDHTYFVGDVDGGVWVHNAPCRATAEQIAQGHAWDKHVVDRGEFGGMGINTPDDFADHIEDVMNNGETKSLDRGRTGYYDQPTNTLVIEDPNSPDLGTAFQPTAGRSYFDNLR